MGGRMLEGRRKDGGGGGAWEPPVIYTPYYFGRRISLQRLLPALIYVFCYLFICFLFFVISLSVFCSLLSFPSFSVI